MIQGKNEFVTHSMKAKCSCGTKDFCQYLNVKMDHGVYLRTGDFPLMNANDHAYEGGENISQFGRCHSPNNPHGKMLESFLATTLLGPLGGLIVSASNAFGYSIMGTPCTPITPFPWRNADSNYLIDGAPALSTKSILTCIYGGTITVVIEDKSTSSDNSSEQSEDAETPVTAQSKRDNLAPDIKGKMDAFIDPSMAQESHRGQEALDIGNEAAIMSPEAMEHQYDMFDAYTYVEPPKPVPLMIPDSYGLPGIYGSNVTPSTVPAPNGSISPLILPNGSPSPFPLPNGNISPLPIPNGSTGPFTPPTGSTGPFNDPFGGSYNSSYGMPYSDLDDCFNLSEEAFSPTSIQVNML